MPPGRTTTRSTSCPARGTFNTQRTWSLATGLEGDLPFKDWTWDLYTSIGEGSTQTEFQGFVSLFNYRTIMSQPITARAIRSIPRWARHSACTSGLSPFAPGAISQDCIDAVASNQTDRQRTNQRVHELTMQGGLFELPAGEVRTAPWTELSQERFRLHAGFAARDRLHQRHLARPVRRRQCRCGRER